MDNRPTILIVDDTLSSIQMLSNAAGDEYEFIYAVTGLEAIALAEKYTPDLILLDVMMPEMDGYEVCKRLKAQKETASIPVIFVTILDHVDDEVHGLEAGAVDFIAKPFHAPSIRAKIKSQLLWKQELLNRSC